jgi:hypothetical protein
LAVEQLEARTVPSATVSGLVFQTVNSVDPSRTSPGPGIAHVPVTATGLHTGTTMSTTTDSNGNYTLSNLPADTYQVSIPQVPAGFWGFTGQSFAATVTLADGQTFANLNFALTPEATALAQNLYHRVLIRPADAAALSA